MFKVNYLTAQKKVKQFVSTYFSDLFFLIPMKEEGKKMLPDILQTGSTQSYGSWVLGFFPFWVLLIWKLPLFNNHHVCYSPFSSSGCSHVCVPCGSFLSSNKVFF